jgi:two-component system, NtrC family, sensor histidine kinase PilS
MIITVGALAFVSSRLRALAFAALGTLAVLGMQSLAAFRGALTVGDMTPAGLFGALLMLLALAASPFARRLSRERGPRPPARHRPRERQPAERVHRAEPAREHRGAGRRQPHPADERGRRQVPRRRPRLARPPGRRGLGALAQAVAHWRERGSADPPPPFASADGATQIAPFFAPIGRPRSGALLVFLEDTSIRSERAQQAKLAALGRLSASIAHEIRNPVGALSHAAQLLAESEELPPAQQRLTEIIDNNAARVSNIVENVLQLSRRERLNPERIDLVAWAKQFVEEFAGSASLPEAAVDLEISGAPLEVRMDPGHLHQVVTNLCENVLRYAIARGRGAARRAGDRPARWQQPAVPRGARPRARDCARPRGAGVRALLPRRHRGQLRTAPGSACSSRAELCEVNRAGLSYQARDGGGSIFRIIFADPQRWET